MKTKRIVFMGSSEFSLVSLSRLVNLEKNVVAVYTREPKPAGRGHKLQKTVVHEYAENLGIPVFTPTSLKSEEELNTFKSMNADLAIVASYGLIIPQSFLDISLFINVHASLLPRWRGASPIQSTILAGDKETGITIMKMNAGLDTGDIISMHSLKITPEITFDELSKKMAELGAEAINYTVDHLETEMSKSAPQSDDGVCYAEKISKNICHIDLNDKVTTNLRKIKAFSTSPGAWTEINGMRLKILDAELADPTKQYTDDFIINCADGALILTSVQPAGKNKMSGQDFIRGYRK